MSYLCCIVQPVRGHGQIPPSELASQSDGDRRKRIQTEMTGMAGASCCASRRPSRLDFHHPPPKERPWEPPFEYSPIANTTTTSYSFTSLYDQTDQTRTYPINIKLPALDLLEALLLRFLVWKQACSCPCPSPWDAPEEIDIEILDGDLHLVVKVESSTWLIHLLVSESGQPSHYLAYCSPRNHRSNTRFNGILSHSWGGHAYIHAGTTRSLERGCDPGAFRRKPRK